VHKTFSNDKAVIVGLLFAMAGFSYALATSQIAGGAGNLGVGTRSATLGTNPLNFTNPKLSDAYSDPVLGFDRDLGDAAVGSSVARYARATGGVRPYVFSSNIASPPSVLANGEVAGALGNLPAGLLRFPIIVTDSLGTQPHQTTNVFRLTLLNNDVFAFGVNALSDATEFQPYFDVLPVLNGASPFTFSASNVLLNGNPTQNSVLEDVGLSLGISDGTIFGKPLASGVLTFTANCTDANNNPATGRGGAGVGQTITLNISSNPLLASDFVATSMHLKAGTTDASDSVSFAGMVNLQGQTLEDLFGRSVVLKIAGYTSPAGIIGSNGKITASAIPVIVAKDTRGVQPRMHRVPTLGAKISGSLNSKGQLKLTISKETIGNTLGVLTSGTKPMAVFLQIGSLVSSAEFLLFSVTTSSTGVSALTYALSGTTALGGDFMLVNVQGQDATGIAADSWQAGFIAVPAEGAPTFGGPLYASVAIGSNFSYTLDVSESSGVLQSSNALKAQQTGVKKLSMNATNGQGSLTTSALAAGATNITTATSADSSASNAFALNVAWFGTNKSVTDGSSVVLGGGQDAMAINAKGKKWSSANPPNP
jgi:hypothetical protein